MWGTVTNKYILDDSGSPIPESDTLKWGEWMQNHWADRRVAEDKTPRGARVSTVFLGLDQSWDGPPPLLYETMVFRDPKTFAESYLDRYSTREEALEGHKKAYLWALKEEKFWKRFSTWLKSIGLVIRRTSAMLVEKLSQLRS